MTEGWVLFLLYVVAAVCFIGLTVWIALILTEESRRARYLEAVGDDR